MRNLFSYLLIISLLSAAAAVSGLMPSAVFAQEKGQAKKERKASNSHRSAPEVVFQGKLVSSLKRNVPIPYKGIVTDVLVTAGQKVKKGDPLIVLQLDPSVIADLRRRVSPQNIQEIEVRVAQVNESIVPLEAKLREVQQLAKQKMASQQNQEQVAKSIESLKKQRAHLQKQMDVLRQSVKDEVAALSSVLGEKVTSDHIPQIVTLRAPIGGHVIWIKHTVRPGAELSKGLGLVIGVMDPMIILAQVFEIEASRMQLGDKATVTVASIPNKTFQATLERISWAPVDPGLGKPSYYPVELSVPNPDLLLKEGYKTKVTMLPEK